MDAFIVGVIAVITILGFLYLAAIAPSGAYLRRLPAVGTLLAFSTSASLYVYIAIKSMHLGTLEFSRSMHLLKLAVLLGIPLAIYAAISAFSSHDPPAKFLFGTASCLLLVMWILLAMFLIPF